MNRNPACNYNIEFFLFKLYSITEAVNETKDKVKYLESLKKYLDQLYLNASPTQIIANVLPVLFNNIRQMDSISRAYARSGYLGLFLSKV